MSTFGLISFNNDKSVVKPTSSNFMMTESCRVQKYVPPVILPEKSIPKTQEAENTSLVKQQQDLKKVVQKHNVINAKKSRSYKKIRVLTFPDGYSCLAYSHSSQMNTQPVFEKKIRQLERYVRSLGYYIGRSDFDRTKENSDKCAQKSKSAHVARGGESAHNYGVGADLVLIGPDGKAIPFNSSKPEIKSIIDYAEKHCNLSWGGRWADNESHHFEYRNWENLFKNEENLFTYEKWRKAKKAT